MICWAATLVMHDVMMRQVDQAIGPSRALRPTAEHAAVPRASFRTSSRSLVDAIKPRSLFWVPLQHTHRFPSPARRAERASSMLQSAALVCLQRPAPARPAARGRSQRGSRAAAYPQPSASAPLWESLARLDDLLSQPRINKALVSEQLEFVKKDVEILEWETAFTIRDLQARALALCCLCGRKWENR